MDIMYYSFNISLLDICILILILFIIKMYKDSKKEKLDENKIINCIMAIVLLDIECGNINIQEEKQLLKVLIKLTTDLKYKTDFVYRNASKMIEITENKDTNELLNLLKREII